VWYNLSSKRIVFKFDRSPNQFLYEQKPFSLIPGRPLEIHVTESYFQRILTNESPAKKFNYTTEEHFQIEEIKNSFFHEILHAANFPMMRYHDRLHAFDDAGYDQQIDAHLFENDPVYACAAQAFPTYIISYLGSAPNHIDYVTNTPLACRTCANVYKTETFEEANETQDRCEKAQSFHRIRASKNATKTATDGH